nr:zinc metalloprotease [Rhodococcus wratislaviensis]
MKELVVLLPGIGGSVLARDGKDVWAPTPGVALAGVLSLGGNIKRLKLDGDDPDVDDLGDGVVATRLVPDFHFVPGLDWKIDGYTKFRDDVVRRFGVLPGDNYFEFPYDWRRDNRVAARALARRSHEWLARWREKSGDADAKLVLVCHSKGDRRHEHQRIRGRSAYAAHVRGDGRAPPTAVRLGVVSHRPIGDREPDHRPGIAAVDRRRRCRTNSGPRPRRVEDCRAEHLDGQIESQIAVLNRDFPTNDDVDTVPSVFEHLVGDAGIEFYLADTDPDGRVTNGIACTATEDDAFDQNDGVKSTETGGADPWPTQRYLNIWVCALGGGLLGYAQFPGGPVATDGVVITHTAFGTTGTARAPFNLRRTATHEIGHYFNLFHVWGDDGTGCRGSDEVGDTPNQGGQIVGMPRFPHISCGNGPHGDLFMDYMDYTDDAGMVMFTKGQGARMGACLDGVRKQLWTGRPGGTESAASALVARSAAGRWGHSFEEDHDGVRVYRPAGFDFPRARGRGGSNSGRTARSSTGRSAGETPTNHAKARGCPPTTGGWR